MNKDHYADITYSRELAEHFKEAEWWWCKWKDEPFIRERDFAEAYEFDENYPALTTDMILDKLKERGSMVIRIDRKHPEGAYKVFFQGGTKCFRDKKLSNALSKIYLWLLKEGLVKK